MLRNAGPTTEDDGNFDKAMLNQIDQLSFAYQTYYTKMTPIWLDSS